MLKKSKIGKMAVTSIDFDAWFKNEPVVKQPVKTNKKFNKKVIYPLFLTYAELTTDIFWVKKFQLWANGKLPKFFTVIDHTITFDKKNIHATWTPTNNPEQDVLSCISFFTVHAGLYSKKDEQNAKLIESSSDSSEHEAIEYGWTNFNKYKQELLIRSYVNELAKSELQLTDKEKKLLLQLIRLGIATKNIQNNAIEINQNKISNIKGVLWNPQTREFRIHVKNK